MAITKKVAERPSTAVATLNRDPSYAGTHLLVELWQGAGWTSLERVEHVLRDSVKACGATLLEIRLHKFSPYDGISGVAIIQESHLSIHTWPEFEYAAVDLFMCGTANPHRAVDVFRRGFRPKRIQVMEVKRGPFDDPEQPLMRGAREVEVEA